MAPQFITRLLVVVISLLTAVPAAAQRRVIDMHLHGYAAVALWDARVANPITGQPLVATNEDAHRRATLAEMKKHNVVLGVVSAVGSDARALLERWTASSPGTFIPAIAFDGPGDVKPEWIREQHRLGKIRVIGEVAAPYAGHSAGDSVYEPFFALAEELDIPIAVHAGSAGGAATYNGYPKYRMELNRPLRLEDMLARHPKARVQVMHAGWPFGDEMVALMRLHPQVFVDLGVISWTQPRAEFHRYLRRLVEAGFGKRVMFGSDQMVWTETIGLAVEAIESAEFLSEAQKADIFCGNAARFLKLQPSPC